MRTKPTKPPAHLGPEGAALWRDLTEEYAVRDAAGLALAELAGSSLDRVRAAQKAIAQHGEMVLDRYGQHKLNPACALEKDARNGMVQALKALHLDIEPLKERGRPAGRRG